MKGPAVDLAVDARRAELETFVRRLEKSHRRFWTREEMRQHGLALQWLKKHRRAYEFQGE